MKNAGSLIFLKVLIVFLLQQLFYNTEVCFAQNKALEVDSAVIKNLLVTYRDTLFSDNFKDDSVDRFPVHWMTGGIEKGNQRSTLYARIKMLNGGKTLLVGWVNGTSFQPMADNKPLRLPDSFVVEYDFVPNRYLFKTDTLDVSPKGVHPAIDWPSYSSHGAWDFAGRREPLRDTVRKYPMPQYLKSYTLGTWHHCVLLSAHNKVTCYITTPKPFVAFTDAAFSFRHLAMGDHDVLYKNVVIKTAANKFDALLTDKKLVTHAISFEVSKAIILKSNESILGELASWLVAHPDVKIEIDGHTDSDGNATANKKLSEKRAVAIKQWLATHGVAPGRLTTKGYGAERPIDTNSTPEGKAMNRRVAFVLIK